VVQPVEYVLMFAVLKITNRLRRVGVLLLLLGLRLAMPLVLAEAAERLSAGERPTAKTEPVQTASAVGLKPGTNDAYIAFWTAKLLERYHYLQHPFDGEISSRFLDRYTRDLDFQRMHFLQSDLADFEGYRHRLNLLTLGRGDTSPAFVIFALFLKRLEQHVDYTTNLLKTEEFTFDTDERVALNRRDLPFPKDLDEARHLWRDRLRAEYLQEKLNGKTHEQIVDALTRRYSRTLKTFREWDSDNVIEAYLAALTHVYDPHSDYMGKSRADDFAISMNLSLFGIGAVLVSDDGYCKIRELVPGGPAAKSKAIKPGDRIVAVAQSNEPPVDVVEMPLSKAVQLIRGPKGTEVRLTVIPADAASQSVQKTVTLIRDEIKLEDKAAKARIIETSASGGGRLRLGVIDLPSFYGNTEFLVGGKEKPHSSAASASADVAKLLNKLEQEGVSGVILDLRNNGGGVLEEAVKVTGLFIKNGPVVQVRDPDGSVAVDGDKDASIAYDGPLVVLTSRFSASASEIVAGALQDYGRALIVGDASTHGKGTVQSLTSLKPFLRRSSVTATNDPGELKLTIRKFYRASGLSTQLKGVTPDIVLPSVDNVAEVGESSLENPLPWDTIDSAKFEHLNRVEPYLAELRQRELERVAVEKDFDYVREDVELAKRYLVDKTVSLNEKQRLKEKAETEAREKAREKERLSRKPPDQEVYELTLKLADQPSLPPPVSKTKTLAATRSESATETANSLTANATNYFTIAASCDEPASAQVPTNSVRLASAAGSDLKAAEQGGSADEEKAPAVDFVLEEAKHILVDYLSLLPKGDVVTANDPNVRH
jgi:carboxyl-terminal processing protease